MSSRTGLGDAVSTVVVAVDVTDWASGTEVAAAKLPSPRYSQVSEWLPTVSADVADVQTALVAPLEAGAVAVASKVAPSLKLTVPVGEPIEVTVHDRVTS